MDGLLHEGKVLAEITEVMAWKMVCVPALDCSRSLSISPTLSSVPQQLTKQISCRFVSCTDSRESAHPATTTIMYLLLNS